ncbi:hypothetical protein HRbin36_00765 [bacterium HR36]|nr:hypothetical protein HRbin36_00765 [bacterium HR36]
MPVARFNCVHCGAPLKTSAELTPDKRIQCPKCETIFPVPAHLLGSSASPGGTVRIGPDLTSGVGAESPRVQLVGMEDILGSEPSRQPSAEAPASSPISEAPSEPPKPTASQPESVQEPWEAELGPSPSVQPAAEGEAASAWAGEISPAEGADSERQAEPKDEFRESPTESTEVEPAVVGEGEEDIVAGEESEVVDLGEEETAKKSSLWIWLILLVVLLLLAGGVVLAWYMGWLDSVLEMMGLASPKPSAQAPVSPPGF